MLNETLSALADKAAGIGTAQKDFDFAGMKVILRVLRVSEELQVRRELNAVMGENPMALDYLYKLEVLGRALHSVNGTDLLAEMQKLADKVGTPDTEKISFVKNLLLSMGSDSVELLFRLYKVLCDQVKLRLLKPFSLEDLLTADERGEIAKLEVIKAAESRRTEAVTAGKE